ncbi:protein CHROMATIN REMODELING 35-like isoform X2 [Phragmites australis]|uniref:protein CHROMATIN REMODELING 35-like isoform X2 n=1 Tax=Phragmites australis TaxID=29695 RepID=UPI002D76CE27|nr:protein CHROMATIN REMODELING 35-like isoform X2 [Phragmites australis]
MAAGGGDPQTPTSGVYYRRQKKSSEPNSSGFALPVANSIGSWGYGSASKDWENIRLRKVQLINFLSSLQRPTENSVITNKMTNGKMTNHSMEQTEQKERTDIIVLDSDDEDGNIAGYEKLSPEINKQLTASELAGSFTKWVASNGRDQANETMLAEGDNNTQIIPYGQSAALVNQFPLETSWQPSIQFERVVLQKRPEEARMQDLVAASIAEKRAETQVFFSLPTEKKRRRSEPRLHVTEDAATVPKQRKRKRKGDLDPAEADFSLDLQQTGISSETNMPLEEEEKPIKESDGLEDYWKDFALAVESTKLDTVDEAANEKEVDNEKEDNDCTHDIRIHEDLGHVCRVCGMIVRRADSIIDYQWKKASRRRTNFYEGHSKDADEMDYGPVKLSEDFIVADIAIHPRHAKQMRPHQLEGFNFLVKNLVADKPGGCILAHAPGSGKTFMLISFIQSFLARYPSARPLVVLPKGILGTWKREVQRWQVQDIPLYDFYSVKADKRIEQLEVLKSWEANMSILFLGYKQFSRIISGDGGGSVAAACRDRLLKVPNLLILDEGHTPRNRDTDVLETLNRVETPRKVVLSGTLFQNHVEEVFNILNLVRPKFLKMESSRPIIRRIMSQVAISGRSSKGIPDSAFTESVEETLLNDDNFKRKAHVIRGLRELTKDVLHYYKGDILDELPGLVDFSVFLKLTPKQKDIVHKLGAYEKFKRSAVGTAVYVHPCLSEISEVNAEDRANSLTDKSVDAMIDSVNVRDGVKARFFINILSLTNSAGEKLLAFSQYILPMKFLERLLVKMKGWHVGKEIFVISGDTSPEDRELAMDQFNNSADAKVLFGSIKACGEGISLVGASRVVILDVHLNPSVTRQAIGRAFRPGQLKKVFVYRLVAAESPEEKFHETAFKKEVIPKLWFEWTEHCTTEDFKLDQIDIDDCGDELLDSKAMRQDIKALYRR